MRRKPRWRTARPGALAWGLGAAVAAATVVISSQVLAGGPGTADAPAKAASVTTAAPSGVAARALRGLDGKAVDLRAPAGGATALIFYSTECPISNAYSPTYNRVAAGFNADKVRFLGVCVDPDLADADVAAHAKDFDLKFPVVRDRDGAAARALGAKVTPEAVVLDDRGRVRYLGRVDDQFAGRQKPNANPATHELRDALTAVIEGRTVAVDRVPAVGCPIPEPPQSNPGK